MRKFFLVSFVLSAMLALAGTGFALEKTQILDTQADEGWTSGSSCTLVYYNRCTGWSYGWTGFGDGGTFGVCGDNCCAPDGGLVTATRQRIFSGAPSGYGFTGTVAIQTVNSECCPNGVLASQPWLPNTAYLGLYSLNLWSQAVPSQFAVVYTMAGAANPGVIGTDHPAIGPTGPQACGFCYPLNRPNHSYAWGSAAAPLCPGSTFNDGVCDAQLRLDIYLTCHPVSVEDSSWGSVKNLYR